MKTGGPAGLGPGRGGGLTVIGGDPCVDERQELLCRFLDRFLGVHDERLEGG